MPFVAGKLAASFSHVARAFTLREFCAMLSARPAPFPGWENLF
jgi:hypothetical protein